jgi:MFS family permease
MAVALDTPTQEIFNKPSRPRTAWLMTLGFLVYTLLILVGHLVGFPLGYAYLRTVCPGGCSLTPGNVRALEHIGLSITFYANLYMVIQLLYILVCVGIALLIVFKKPGRWVPLGMSAFLVGLSAYEGANYPALAATYPVLYAPTQLLIGLGMGLLGMYALLTFPNGTFGSHWVLLFYLVNSVAVVLFAFLTAPVFVSINTVFTLLSFPLIIGILIYRSRCLLNPKERAATKWIMVSLSTFILFILLVFFVIPAIVPADSFALLIVNIAGFFGCGINIAGFLMAVLYANAFDIDVFVRRTLVYTLLTAILAVLYVGMILGSQFVFATFSSQAAQSPLILVASTLVIAALFQPFRHHIQRIIDRRFYRSRYDAHKIVAAFSSTLRQEVDPDTLREQLLAVVQETMQPAHVSLWLRAPEHDGKQRAPWRATPPVSSEGR